MACNSIPSPSALPAASTSLRISCSARAAMQIDLAETRRQRIYGLSFDALILHCPSPQRAPENPFHTQWLAACEAFFADDETRGRLDDAPALTIVTYNTNPEEC